MTTMNRRLFLKSSALAALALLPCSPFACPGNRALAKLATDNYYPAHEQQLIANFTDTLQGAVQFLTPELLKHSRLYLPHQQKFHSANDHTKKFLAQGLIFAHKCAC